MRVNRLIREQVEVLRLASAHPQRQGGAAIEDEVTRQLAELRSQALLRRGKHVESRLDGRHAIRRAGRGPAGPSPRR